MSDKMPQYDPRELMRLAKNGDTAAFGLLYNLYFTPVFRYIFARVRENETAADLTQTVFLKAFQARERYAERGMAPLAYFFTVARNTVIDHWRKKKEVAVDAREQIDTFGADVVDDPADAAERNERMRAVARAIELLTEEQQEVIAMKFISDLSTVEIAAATGRTEEAARQLASRAVKALRERIAEYNI